VPDLLPFRGLRYAGSGLDAVTAPPYDVIDEDERAMLEARDPNNAVRLILPRDTPTTDRYTGAAACLARWRAEGVLRADDAPSLYAYRMRFTDAGSPRVTTGVIGALALAGTDDVLPHERTLPKARSDRLALLQATRANFDPIWGLSLGTGLTRAVEPTLAAVTARAIDDDGVVHELARIGDAEHIAAVQAAIAPAPIVLADGHHRYATARDYSAQHPGDAPAAAVMALVVELDDEQLCVHAIHRVLSGVPDTLRRDLAAGFDVVPTGPNDSATVEGLERRMGTAGGLGLVDREGTALLVPKPGVLGPALADEAPVVRGVDPACFDALVRPRLGDATIEYRSDAGLVAALVDKGAADAAVLLRPIPVTTIRQAALARVEMPEKSTYFAPKPRTGMVLRAFDA
jgi:uncharacterized protein (DUF1015 family)